MYDEEYYDEQDYGYTDAELMYDEEETEEIPPVEAGSADEALLICLDIHGRVDLKYMSRISGIGVEELISELDGSAIFQDPAEFEYRFTWDACDGWVVAPRYLCGNLRHKLKLAEAARQRFRGKFATNVKALRERMPQHVSLEDIHVSLGSPWVPERLYSAFVTELLDLNNAVPVYMSPELARWMVRIPSNANRSVRNTQTYGTVDMSALKIIEATMNAKTVKIYDTKPSISHGSERVLNLEKTLKAQEKQQAILEEFAQWIYGDEERRRVLEEAYNDTFVGFDFSPYDGSFLSLKDLNPAVTLFRHQRNAVARILLSKSNVLLCHDVGAGKTFEMIVGIHELKRMGKSGKNLIVVPNSVLQATVDAHRYLYPHDDIQVIYPHKFTISKRKAVLEALRDEDHVVTYMAYSSFDLVKMSNQYWEEEITRQIHALHDAAANTNRSEERKELKHQAKILAEKRRKMLEDAVDDTDQVTFEDLGIETLVVDEAHNYKNIPFESRADNIVGRNTSGSDKCRQMLAKCHCVNRVIFATGTPMTNSISDLFAMMTYLQPGDLKFWNIETFDMWINAFGERLTDYEVDVGGDGLRLMTRFNSFRNLTELMSMFAAVCDFHHVHKDRKDLPKFSGYRDIMVPKNELQAAYIKDLAERTERIRTRQVSRHVDNLLKVTTDGRKCALDIRLVGGDVPMEEPISSKVRACAVEVAKLYGAYPDTCQVVFCDIGTPKAAFNIYSALRDTLETLGIPREQVAFIHDADSEAKRARLFAAMNAGQIRIAIGSTVKLGVGVNVQERLVAVHHLSIPWKPGDIIQREGRILRQGNRCDEVFIYRYITEGTFDAYSWQLLQNKQQFITSFLAGTSAARESADIMDTVLNYAEIKALAIGNPAIRERCEVANMLERAKIAFRHRQQQMIDLRTVMEKAPEHLKKLSRLAAITEKDWDEYKELVNSDEWEPLSQEDRDGFDEELQLALKENVLVEREREFDAYACFRVMLPAEMVEEYPYVWLTSDNGGKYMVELKRDEKHGHFDRVEKVVTQLGSRAKKLREQIEETVQRARHAQQDLDKGNPYEKRVEVLKAKLDEIDKKLNEDEEAA